VTDHQCRWLWVKAQALGSAAYANARREGWSAGEASVIARGVMRDFWEIWCWK